MNINFNKFDLIDNGSKDNFKKVISEQPSRRNIDPRVLQRVLSFIRQRKSSNKKDVSGQQRSYGPGSSEDGGGMGNLGGLMQQMMGGGQGQQDIPMWDAFSGKKQPFIRATDNQQGLESSRDINGNIMKGYMQAASQMRVSQPSGGTDPTKFNVPHGSGTDPRMVRGLSQEELPLSMDHKALDKASMQARQAGMQDPQIAAPHQQIPGAPVDIPDGMGGVDQQKAQAMAGAQFFGGTPEIPQTSQPPQQQQSGLPQIGGEKKAGSDMIQQIMQKPEVIKLLKKLLSKKVKI